MPDSNRPDTNESPSISKQGVSASGRASLAMLCIYSMALYAMYFGAFSVILPRIGLTFRLGTEAEGRLFPANFSGFVVGVLLSGILSDRIGRRLALIPAAFLFSLGLFLFAKTDSFSIVLVASALIGAGSGSMEVIASALISDLFPIRRAIALNGIQIVFGFGAAISPYLAFRFLNAGTPWQSMYLFFSILTLLLFVWLLFARSEKKASADGTLDLHALKTILKRPDFLALCLIQLFYVGAETGFFTWMPTYFEKALPGGKSLSGIVVTIFWLSMTVGRMITGTLIGKFPLMRLNLILATGGFIGSLLAVAVLNPYFTLFSVALTGLSFSGIFGMVMAEAGERYPTLAGTVFGAIISSCGIGGAVLPWAIGALSESALGWRGALLLVPFFSLIVIGLSFYLLRSKPADSQPE